MIRLPLPRVRWRSVALFRVRRWLMVLGCSLLAVAPAAAKDRLRTFWTLEPMGPIGAIKSRWSRTFLVERLVPTSLVQLRDSVSIDSKLTATAGDFLYTVYDAETHQAGFCAIKSGTRVNGKPGKTFIRPYEKRPCFIDRDGDGRFDSYFTVFDDDGRTITPTGDMATALPLPRLVGYDRVDPHLYPVAPKLSFNLAASKDPNRVGIELFFDTGGGVCCSTPFWFPVKHDGPRFTVANLIVTMTQVVDGEASFTVATDPAIGMTTDKDGNVMTAPFPDFLLR